MDKLERYRQILQNIIVCHAEMKSSDTQTELMPVCDTSHDNYLLMHVGWTKRGRTHATIIHMRIHEDKIWIEWDGTEYSVAQEMLDAGIPNEDIVLAFYRPDRRMLTEFAAS